MSTNQNEYIKKFLGQILLEMGKISPLDIDIALKEQKRTGSPIGDILIRNEIVSEQEAYQALAVQFDLPFLQLDEIHVDSKVQEILPLSFIQEKAVLPLGIENNVLQVAISTPDNLVVIDEIQRKTGQFVKPALMTSSDLAMGIERFYLLNVIPLDDRIEKNLSTYEELRVSLDDHTDEILGCVVDLFDNIVKMAQHHRATDIHIEPARQVTRIRFRIDGVLQPGPTLPRAIHESFISRIKILSNLKIDETRFAQDGKAIFHYLNKALDLRISVIPTIHGESVVIRVLERTNLQKSLPDIGFGKRSLDAYLQAVSSKVGIVLITGPTGSGKTTTLSSTISYLNSYEVNIVTIEDPVEYEIPFVRQIQVNEDFGIGFESGMRALLRHDPDIILLGEMRDLPSAQIAVRAAMTGHLVLSTLHTNNAVDSIPRLIELGLQPFVLASALQAIVAQRLMRRICPACKEVDQVDPRTIKFFAEASGADDPNAEIQKLEGETFYKGAGCPSCNNTGFRGRIALFEIMTATPEIKSLIAAEKTSAEILQKAKSQGMKILIQDAFQKAREGLITINEALTLSLE